MKHLLIISLLLCLSSCGTTRRLTSSESDTKTDSTSVRVSERVVFVPDTVYYEIPAQEAVRETPDTCSRLENEYAESEAVWSGGLLRHTLTTKPQRKAVPTKAQVITRDSIVYRDRYIDRTKTVIREKKPPFWKSALFWGCTGLFLLVVITYTIKQIEPHIRRFLKK